jgi:outer membrane protein assembly factor BamB
MERDQERGLEDAPARARLVLARRLRETGLADHRHPRGQGAVRARARSGERAGPRRPEALRRGPAGGHAEIQQLRVPHTRDRKGAGLRPLRELRDGRHTGSSEVRWSRRDLPCNHWRGPGSSPILEGDFLIVHFDGFDLQYAVALDKDTGRTVWKADRTHDYATDDGDQKKGFSTPIVIEASGRRQLISPAAKAVVSLDPKTGRELWRVRYEQHSPATRPLFAHGLVYLSTGFSKADLLAIRPDGRGDVTETHVAWKVTKGIGNKPSPLVVDDLIYSVSDTGGVVSCLDAKTGAEVWQYRVGGGAHTSSLLFGDGAIYAFAEDGSAIALRPGREFVELGRGRLDEGGVKATPAIAGRSIFLRSESHLYRLEIRP